MIACILVTRAKWPRSCKPWATRPIFTSPPPAGTATAKTTGSAPPLPPLGTISCAAPLAGNRTKGKRRCFPREWALRPHLPKRGGPEVTAHDCVLLDLSLAISFHLAFHPACESFCLCYFEGDVIGRQPIIEEDGLITHQGAVGHGVG